MAGIELGSFAKAAVRLCRSQSAVSMQLRKLEQQAGQRLVRKNGRGLAVTEAGDVLLNYARRIIALNDEAAASVGATAAVASVGIGMPQDFAEDVLPQVLERFCPQWPGVHVEARSGRNYALPDLISEQRLDVAVIFSQPGAAFPGRLVAGLPMYWVGRADPPLNFTGEQVPLVLFDHPCLFRQAAVEALEAAGLERRMALTTPSLPGVWAALRSGLGITVRTGHQLPGDMRVLGPELGLPPLPALEVHLLAGEDLSPAAEGLRQVTEQVLSGQLRQV